MSDLADVEAILGYARELEIDSKWLHAVEYYNRALKQVSRLRLRMERKKSIRYWRLQ
jgi:hypothetical protein